MAALLSLSFGSRSFSAAGGSSKTNSPNKESLKIGKKSQKKSRTNRRLSEKKKKMLKIGIPAAIVTGSLGTFGLIKLFGDKSYPKDKEELKAIFGADCGFTFVSEIEKGIGYQRFIVKRGADEKCIVFRGKLPSQEIVTQILKENSKIHNLIICDISEIPNEFLKNNDNVYELMFYRVKKIRSGAFFGCKGVKRISFPSFLQDTPVFYPKGPDPGSSIKIMYS